MLSRLSNVMRLTSIGLLLSLAGGLSATTLERLTLDEMIQKSTEIIRARVSSLGSVKRGALIYTQARVSVSERLKGTGEASVDVHIPGGVYGRERMTISGAPQLRAGYEYVLFLWTGRNGITQLLGFSQGVFDLKPAANTGGKNEAIAYREATTEPMVDARTGQEVSDAPVWIKLSELRGRIGRAMAAAQ
jgi:hypothetical protein